MNKQYKVFTEVAPFYQDMLQALSAAEKKISMMYFTYDAGEWTIKMNEILFKKVEQDVEVRIMVDLMGFFADNPQNIFRNIAQVANMKRKGIQFDFFQPGKLSNMSPVHRLHFKLCAIDEIIAYIGGSNIGDHYTSWQDTNLRVQCEIGEIGHQLYDYVLAHSDDKQEIPKIDLDNIYFGEAKLLLTVPGVRKDISVYWVNLIETSNTRIYFRNWYFLPNKVFMKAMLEKLELGVELEVLLSHRTRVPVIDIANHTQSRKLVRAGANIYRYQSRYMHSKVTWNSEDEILFGSANLEDKALKANFELCLRFKDRGVCEILTKSYLRDIKSCLHQTIKVVEKRIFTNRMVSYIFSLATPLL